MWLHAAILIAVLLALVFALELLNAFYAAMLRGQAESFGKRLSAGNIFVWVALTARLWLTRAMLFADRLSHWIHELAHALFQFFAGARPRVVMCAGGGYAEARPWPIPGGRLVYHLGMTFWRGLTSMAPLVVASGAMLAAVWFLSPWDGATASAAASTLTTAAPSALPAAAVEVASTFVGSILAASLPRMLGIFAVALLISGHATPSSVDFVNARSALPAYAVATIAAVFVYDLRPASGAMISSGAGALATVGCLVWRLRRGQAEGTLEWLEGVQRFLETLAATTLVLGAVGFLAPMRIAPDVTVVHGIGLALVALVAMATTYVFFAALMAALSLSSFSIRPLWYGLRALPGALRSVFTSIAICPDERIMFQDECDKCGCALREFKRNGCGHS